MLLGVQGSATVLVLPGCTCTGEEEPAQVERRTGAPRIFWNKN
jgi:hypothetical protein